MVEAIPSDNAAVELTAPKTNDSSGSTKGGMTKGDEEQTLGQKQKRVHNHDDYLDH
jgi:hypothetical protein